MGAAAAAWGKEDGLLHPWIGSGLCCGEEEQGGRWAEEMGAGSSAMGARRRGEDWFCAQRRPSRRWGASWERAGGRAAARLKGALPWGPAGLRKKKGEEGCAPREGWGRTPCWMGAGRHGCWRLKTTEKTARRGKHRLEKWRLWRARLLRCEEEGAEAPRHGRGGAELLATAVGRRARQPWEEESSCALNRERSCA
jgi:hypothetical protein